ncbi:MAG: hypothetical protein LBU60_04510 [Clostridiales bacterium]|jgi:hypothetical protein|nr:hypothetical protein [Clostridiales bacterium]
MLGGVGGFLTQIGINSSLGILNYVTSTLINSSKITVGGIISSSILGAIAGVIGEITIGENASPFIKHILEYGKEFVSSVIIGGLIDGLYSKLSEIWNPKKQFIGWEWPLKYRPLFFL